MSNNNNNIELEALSCLEKGDKKATSFSFFSGNKYDEAFECYTKAGNLFKQIKKCTHKTNKSLNLIIGKEAGDAYRKAAEMSEKLQEKTDTISRLGSAAQCYKKASPQSAIEVLERCIELLIENGRFSTAANHEKEIAEIHEEVFSDYGKAIEHYLKAADWYLGEDAKSSANNCFLKVAHFAALLENYELAVDKFEAAAMNNIDNNLTKWSVKEYLMKAGLCCLCSGDEIHTRKSMEKYYQIDPNFQDSREAKFVENLLMAVEAGDSQQFTDFVADYDRMTKLDNWKTTILLKIKKSIEAEPSLT